MMKYRFSFAVALLIIAVIAAWFFYYKLQTQPGVDDTLREQFSWQLSVTSTGTAGPRTTVSLRIAGVSVPVNTYSGTCDDPLTYLPGEVSGVVCKTASGGIEVGVFRENGRLVLKDGAIDPATGRGSNFSPIKKQ